MPRVRGPRRMTASGVAARSTAQRRRTECDGVTTRRICRKTAALFLALGGRRRPPKVVVTIGAGLLHGREGRLELVERAVLALRGSFGEGRSLGFEVGLVFPNLRQGAGLGA